MNLIISEEDFLKLDLNDVYIIDVRHPFEQVTGYLGISVNIPFVELISIPLSIPKNKTILTYCNYGNRAGRSALILREHGYNAYSLGGYALFSEKLKKRCHKLS
ncbi:MAG: rhodanese-like domain-containing protein [Brevinema sp.]